eukprot:9198591-Alexandrium_andersonii.AAC.1
MREKWRDPNSPYGKLVVANKDLQADEDLFEALVGLHEAKRDTTAFYTWAEQVTSINQSTVVALFKNCLITPVMRSLPNAMLVIESLKVIKRLNVPEQYPREWAAVKQHMDLALQKQLSEFHKQDISSAAWWDQAEAYAPALLPAAATTRCMACEGKWQDVEADVKEVYSSGGIGQKLVGRIMKQLDLERV